MSAIGVADVPVALPAPQPPPYSLRAAAALVVDADEHWLGGVEARRWYEDAVSAWSGVIGSSVAGKSAPTRELGTVKSQPFTIEQAFTCMRGYIESESLFQARALTAFSAFEDRAVEFQFWTGALAVAMPHLDDLNAEVLTGGTAVKPRLGVALLEQAIADAAIPGLIHMRPGLAEILGSNYASVSGGVAHTNLGTTIALGTGYPGTGKGGAAKTGYVEYAFVSGPVVMRRGPVQVFPMLDRDTNDWVVRIERDYLILFDTQLQALVEVDKALA